MLACAMAVGIAMIMLLSVCDVIYCAFVLVALTYRVQTFSVVDSPRNVVFYRPGMNSPAGGGEVYVVT